jgi:hypothetical protein
MEGIEPVPIHLRFSSKGDKIDFRIDAQHVLSAKEISSVWPSSAFFSTVKSDVYDLQLVLETRNGLGESPKVTISIDATKPAKPFSAAEGIHTKWIGSVPGKAETGEVILGPKGLQLHSETFPAHAS